MHRSRAAVGIALLFLVPGCMRKPTPQILVGPLTMGLNAFLIEHPLKAGQALRSDEVARSASASHHLVQVRDREAPHQHAKHELTVVVVRGSGELALGRERQTMRVGDVVMIPRGVPHFFRNTGREPAVAFATFSPPLTGPDSVPVSIDSMNRRE